MPPKHVAIGATLIKPVATTDFERSHGLGDMWLAKEHMIATVDVPESGDLVFLSRGLAFNAFFFIILAWKEGAQRHHRKKHMAAAKSDGFTFLKESESSVELRFGKFDARTTAWTFGHPLKK